METDKKINLQDKAWYRFLKIVYIFCLIITEIILALIMHDEYWYFAEQMKWFAIWTIPVFLVFEIIRRSFFYVVVNKPITTKNELKRAYKIIDVIGKILLGITGLIINILNEFMKLILKFWKRIGAFLNTKKNLIFLSVFIIIVLGIVLSLYIINKPIITEYNVQHSSVSVTTPSEIIKDIQNGVPTWVVSKLEPHTLWWITEDNYNIIIDSADSLSFEIKTTNQTSYENRLSYIVTLPFVKSLFANIEETMINNGFDKNIKNSSKDTSDDTFHDYVQAFQKDDVVCIWVVNPDVYIGKEIEARFTCSSDLTKSYNIQKRFLDDLELKDSQAVVFPRTKIDNFYNISIAFRRTGAYIIAKEIDGKITKIFEGQDIMPCSLVLEYDIPKSVFGECYYE